MVSANHEDFDEELTLYIGKSFYTLSLLIHYEKEKGCFTPVVLRNSAALTSWLDTSSQHWNHTLSGLVAPSAKRDSLLKWWVQCISCFLHNVTNSVLLVIKYSLALSASAPAPRP